MRNEMNRMKAMIQYASEGLNRAEKARGDSTAVDELTRVHKSNGELEGTLRVMIVDCQSWLAEMIDEQRERYKAYDAALGEGRH